MPLTSSTATNRSTRSCDGQLPDKQRFYGIIGNRDKEKRIRTDIFHKHGLHSLDDMRTSPSAGRSFPENRRGRVSAN